MEQRSERKPARVVFGLLLGGMLLLIMVLVAWRAHHVRFFLAHGWETYQVVSVETLTKDTKRPASWKSLTFDEIGFSVPTDGGIEMRTHPSPIGERDCPQIELGSGRKLTVLYGNIQSSDVESSVDYFRSLPPGLPHTRAEFVATAYEASPKSFHWMMPGDRLAELDFMLSQKQTVCMSNTEAVMIRQEDQWDGLLTIFGNHASFAWESHDFRQGGSLLFETPPGTDVEWIKQICETVQIDLSRQEEAK